MTRMPLLHCSCSNLVSPVNACQGAIRKRSTVVVAMMCPAANSGDLSMQKNSRDLARGSYGKKQKRNSIPPNQKKTFGHNMLQFRALHRAQAHELGKHFKTQTPQTPSRRLFRSRAHVQWRRRHPAVLEERRGALRFWVPGQYCTPLRSSPSFFWAAFQEPNQVTMIRRPYRLLDLHGMTV